MAARRSACARGDGYCIQPLEVHEFRAEARDAVILAVQISPRIFDAFFPNPRRCVMAEGSNCAARSATRKSSAGSCHVSVPSAQLSGKAPGLRIRLFCVDCRDTGIAGSRASFRGAVAGGMAAHPPAQRALRRHHGLHRRKLPPQAAARGDRPARGPDHALSFASFQGYAGHVLSGIPEKTAL